MRLVLKGLEFELKPIEAGSKTPMGYFDIEPWFSEHHAPSMQLVDASTKVVYSYDCKEKKEVFRGMGRDGRITLTNNLMLWGRAAPNEMPSEAGTQALVKKLLKVGGFGSVGDIDKQINSTLGTVEARAPYALAKFTYQPDKSYDIKMIVTYAHYQMVEVAEAFAGLIYLSVPVAVRFETKQTGACRGAEMPDDLFIPTDRTKLQDLRLPRSAGRALQNDYLERLRKELEKELERAKADPKETPGEGDDPKRVAERNKARQDRIDRLRKEMERLAELQKKKTND